MNKNVLEELYLQIKEMKFKNSSILMPGSLHFNFKNKNVPSFTFLFSKRDFSIPDLQIYKVNSEPKQHAELLETAAHFWET